MLELELLDVQTVLQTWTAEYHLSCLGSLSLNIQFNASLIAQGLLKYNCSDLFCSHSALRHSLRYYEILYVRCLFTGQDRTEKLYHSSIILIGLNTVYYLYQLFSACYVGFPFKVSSDLTQS